MPIKKLPSSNKETDPSASKTIVLLSSCLAGLRTRYDGNHKQKRELLRRLKGSAILPVCPEQLGGLPTPRSRAQIVGGDGTDVLRGKARVINEQAQDVTAQFIKGAKETLKIIRLNGAKRAFLKEGSPSCGTLRSVRGKRDSGPGVTTALLLKEGIEVISVD